MVTGTDRQGDAHSVRQPSGALGSQAAPWRRTSLTSLSAILRTPAYYNSTQLGSIAANNNLFITEVDAMRPPFMSLAALWVAAVCCSGQAGTGAFVPRDGSSMRAESSLAEGVSASLRPGAEARGLPLVLRFTAQSNMVH
ncbi:hypothetical protein PtB15_2B539 [Puccinia triticina]|nr:hypothetical protein PtB15_2B539 [Puccinia triticina]